MTSKEAKKLFKKTYFWNETLGQYYHFISDKEEFEKTMNWLGLGCPKLYSGRCQVIINGDAEERIIIGVFNNDDSTLVHECIHAGLFTMEIIGQKIPYDDEFLPYITTWIFRECKKKMDKEEICNGD